MPSQNDGMRKVLEESEYLQKHKVPELVDEIIKRLLDAKVEDPGKLVAGIVEKWSNTGLALTPLAPPHGDASSSPRKKCSQNNLDNSEYKRALLGFSEASKSLARKVQDGLREGETPWQQNSIYKGMGLHHMLQQALHFKGAFDSLGKELIQMLNESGIEASFVAAPVKSLKSANLKVGIKNNGDVCQLTDAVRGTICIKGGTDPANLAKAYDALNRLVQARSILEKSGAKFTHFADRYQSPLGDYKDFLFLMRVQDFVCELQVNFESALKQKEEQLHKKYEKSRLSQAKLLEAAMHGDADLVELMIEAGASVGSRDQNGSTPLHYAARHGSEQMLTALLNAGADALAMDASGCTALYHAIVMCHPGVIQVLLEKMEARVRDLSSLPSRFKKQLQKMHSVSLALHDVDIYDRIGQLVASAFGGRVKTLQAICYNGDRLGLEKFIKSDGADEKELSTTFMFVGEANSMCDVLDMAILGGSVDVVRFLIEESGYDEKQNQHDSTVRTFEAAKWYVENQQSRALIALLEYENSKEQQHATSSLKNNKEQLSELLYHAIRSSNWSAAKILKETGAELTQALAAQASHMLFPAAALNDTDIVRMLLEAGVPPDSKDDSTGTGALHCAADSGSLDCLRVLIDAKANVDLLSNTKHIQAGSLHQSPLLYAVGERQRPAIELLLEAGASKTAGGAADRVPYPWETPAGFAVWLGLTDFFPYMIDMGFDFSVDLLEYAKNNGKTQTAELLDQLQKKRASENTQLTNLLDTAVGPL